VGEIWKKVGEDVEKGVTNANEEEGNEEEKEWMKKEKTKKRETDQWRNHSARCKNLSTKREPVVI
jgi:hypothetical protein